MTCCCASRGLSWAAGPAGADGRELLAAAMTDWARPAPHCPQWDAAELVRHMGGILGWMARIVTTGQQVSRRDRETGPADLDSLSAWYSAHLQRVDQAQIVADQLAGDRRQL
jgi:Mycothiol maleylpyruvate isomerase N-terminal domain